MGIFRLVIRLRSPLFSSLELTLQLEPNPAGLESVVNVFFEAFYCRKHIHRVPPHYD